MKTCADLLTLQQRGSLVPGELCNHAEKLHPVIHAWLGRAGPPGRMRKVFLESYLTSCKELSTPERLDGANSNFTGSSLPEELGLHPLEELD